MAGEAEQVMGVGECGRVRGRGLDGGSRELWNGTGDSSGVCGSAV